MLFWPSGKLLYDSARAAPDLAHSVPHSEAESYFGGQDYNSVGNRWSQAVGCTNGEFRVMDLELRFRFAVV